METWSEWAKAKGVVKPDHVSDNLEDLVDEIRYYLKSFRSMDGDNLVSGKFSSPDVSATTRTIRIRYVFGRYYSMDKKQAQNYVRWLRLGHVGTHWDAGWTKLAANE